MDKKIIFLFLVLTIPIIGIKAGSHNILQFGAKSGKSIDNTKAIQTAIDKCASLGGGEVVIPSGLFETGTIYLRSKIHLKLETGAILQGSYRSDDYQSVDLRDYMPHYDPKKTVDSPQIRALILAEKVEDVQITGNGLIRGAGDSEDFHPSGSEKGFQPELYKSQRPMNIVFLGSKKITLKNFKSDNSAAWTIALLDCTLANIDGLNVKSDANWTSDGIDICGSNITISNCIIDTQDDAICIKSEYSKQICENIAITNCIIASQCNGIKMGTASHIGFKNITVSNCIIQKPSLKNFKYNKFSEQEVVNPPINTVITGITILGVDGGLVENILFDNIIMNDVLCPFFIRVGDRNRNKEGKLSIMRNISLSNITAKSRSILPGMISGQPDSPLTDIRLSNIYIENEISVDNNFLSTFPTLIAENKSGYPECTITFGRRIPASGIYLKNVDGLFMNNIHIRTKPDEARPLFKLENVSGIFKSSIFHNNKELKEANIHN